MEVSLELRASVRQRDGRQASSRAGGFLLTGFESSHVDLNVIVNFKHLARLEAVIAQFGDVMVHSTVAGTA